MVRKLIIYRCFPSVCTDGCFQRRCSLQTNACTFRAASNLLAHFMGSDDDSLFSRFLFEQDTLGAVPGATGQKAASSVWVAKIRSGARVHID